MQTKKEWVDYKELKQKVGIKEILERYGLLAGMRQSKDELIGFCPFHKESKPSFHASLTKNAYQCFGCKAKGNILDFVQQKESVELREAGLLISKWFGIGSQPTAAPKPSYALKEGDNKAELAKEEEIANPPLKFALKLDPAHPYLKERGISDETIESFGLGFCSRGLLKGRIAIPIHDEVGELVAYAGRWPGDPPEGEGKYKLPPGFKKHLVLYNLHRAVKEAPAGNFILVEGFFDCFRVWQSGFKNVVALMGSALSKEQEELLAAFAKKIILMLDRDEAGQKATQEILPRLAKRFFVKVIELPSEGSQPDKLEKNTLASLLKE
ncbi:toprim domain-containing protein [Candidatus Shapirobacteria bacterium]|nr:toprim domain-containing protein [Candidatus Shapirobacteria bacterium]